MDTVTVIIGDETPVEIDGATAIEFHIADAGWEWERRIIRYEVPQVVVQVRVDDLPLFTRKMFEMKDIVMLEIVRAKE